MPCRVPKRRFSCGAPQHLTKNPKKGLPAGSPFFFFTNLYLNKFVKTMMTLELIKSINKAPTSGTQKNARVEGPWLSLIHI